MRRAVTLVASVLLAAASPANGQLYAALKAAPDEQAAGAVEARLHMIARAAGSPAAGILVDRAVRELQANAPGPATDDLDAALTIDPGFTEALSMRAAAKLMDGHAREAVVDAGAALKLDPRAFSAMQTLSRALEALGDFKGALAAWDQALLLDPQTHDARARHTVLSRRALGEDI